MRPDIARLKGKVIKLLKSGKKPFEIRRKLPAVAPCFISNCRAELGLPKFQRGFKRDIQGIETVRRMKSAGLTYAMIGERLGISGNAAQARLRYDRDLSKCVCDRCGSKAGPMHHHHTDYNKGTTYPLCVSCHAQLHGGFKFERFKVLFGHRKDVLHFEEISAIIPCCYGSFLVWCKRLRLKRFIKPNTAIENWKRIRAERAALI